MLVFIPILAMLALEFIVPAARKPSLKVFLSLMGGGLFLFMGVRLVLPIAWIYPEGEAVVRVRSQVTHLLSVPGWQKKPIFILEGSSATEYGINGQLLERLLAEKSIPATVVQFSLPGANHFERLFMMHLFLEELGKEHRQELVAAPTFLFSEVFDAYDLEPLYLFKKEAYTLRAIQWLYPSNALAAWRASRAQDRRQDAKLSWTLFEHLLLNQCSVGVFSSLQPLNYKKMINAFCPLSGIKKSFNYEKTAQQFEASLTQPPEVKLPEIPPAGWQVYYQELVQELGGACHSLVFYALPTLEPQRRAYQEAFTKQLPPHTIMLAPATVTFMKNLLEEKNWFDGVHPQAAGAFLFTRWFAEEIAQAWPQILATPWNIETSRK